jgi:hypothetical protein
MLRMVSVLVGIAPPVGKNLIRYGEFGPFGG